MSDASIERFAGYSDEELAVLVYELERGRDDRLVRLIAAVKRELERRRGPGVPGS